MIYIALYIILAFFALLDLLKNGERIKPIVFWFCVIVLVFISSIRWNVGTDWTSYIDFYQHINNYVDRPELNMMERGFTYLNYLIATIGFGYSGYLAIMAILMIGLKGKVFYEHQQIMMMCLFLFFCYYLADIFGVRQFLAISVTLYSVRYIRQRRVYPFLFCVFTASSIHVTALFFLFSYWIYPIKYSPKLLYSILFISLLLGFLDIGGLAARLVMDMVGIDSRVGDKLMQYGSEGMDTATAVNPYIAFTIGVLKRAIFLPIFISCQKYIASSYRAAYTGYLNLLVFGNVIYLIFMISLPVMARLSTGFLIFEIFIIAYLIVSVRHKWLRFLGFLVMLLFGAFRLYSLISVYWDLYVPFETIFAPSNIQRE